MVGHPAAFTDNQGLGALVADIRFDAEIGRLATAPIAFPRRVGGQISGDVFGTLKIDLFGRWFADAAACGLEEHTACALATAAADGRPSCRMVLLKEHGKSGFVFYTNLESPKARDLAENPQAELCFHWMPLKRQVRIHGPVEPVEPEVADAYFATRPRLSQVGAWASHQSQPMRRPYDLEKNVMATAARYGFGKVPRPPHWSGFRLRAESIEFWMEKPFRQHHRIRFRRKDDGWLKERLFP